MMMNNDSDDNVCIDQRVIAHVVVLTSIHVEEIIPKFECWIQSILMDFGKRARKRRRFLLELEYPWDVHCPKKKQSSSNQEEEEEEDVSVNVSRNIEIIKSNEIFIDLTDSCEFLLQAKETIGEEEMKLNCRPEWWKRPRWSWTYHQLLLGMGAQLVSKFNTDCKMIGISSNKILAQLPYWYQTTTTNQSSSSSSCNIEILDPYHDEVLIQRQLSSIPLTKIYYKKEIQTTTTTIQSISDLFQFPKCSLSIHIPDIHRLWENAKGICHLPVIDNWKQPKKQTNNNRTKKLVSKKKQLYTSYQTKRQKIQPKLDSNGFDRSVWNELPPTIRSEIRIHVNEQNRKQQQQSKRRSPTFMKSKQRKYSSPITKWTIPQSR